MVRIARTLHLLTCCLLVGHCASDRLNEEVMINYCKLPCGTVHHIACNSSCSTAPHVFVIYPTFNWRLNMLDLHNDFRDRLAGGNYSRFGKASNMQVLNYHLRLEFTAACWLIAYDTPRKSPCAIVPEHSRVSQNLYVGKEDPRTDEGLEAIFNSWTSGVKDATKDQIYSYTFTTEHVDEFITTAWALTTHIGCAAVRKAGLYRVLCNYGPGGNLRHKSVFWRGTPRTECVGWSDNLYDNLCGRIEHMPEAIYQVGNPELRRWKVSRATTEMLSTDVAAVLVMAWLTQRLL